MGVGPILQVRKQRTGPVTHLKEDWSQSLFPQQVDFWHFLGCQVELGFLKVGSDMAGDILYSYALEVPIMSPASGRVFVLLGVGLGVPGVTHRQVVDTGHVGDSPAHALL